jgi:DNA topoisomerase IA
LRRFIPDTPDTARRYVKSQVDAVHLLKTHRKTSVAVGKYLRQTANKEVLERIFDLSSTDEKYPLKQNPLLPGIQEVLDAIAEENPKAKTAPPEKFVDSQFIKELDDSGYVDGLYKAKAK